MVDLLCTETLGESRNMWDQFRSGSKPHNLAESSFQTKLIFFQTTFIVQLLCASTPLNVLRTKTTVFFTRRVYFPLVRRQRSKYWVPI